MPANVHLLRYGAKVGVFPDVSELERGFLAEL